MNFINGVQSASIVLPVAAVLEPITGFRVGTYRNADGRWFDGSIDEVAIWDRTLTPAEVTEVYTLGTSNQAIPEPSALLLAGLGALQLLRRRR